MEREIKFRAFIPKVQKMLESVYITPSNMIGMSDEELFEQLGTDEPDENIFLSGEEWYWIEENNYCLMQFTGLKDKNGKEIFEGDILRCVFNEYDEHCGEYEHKDIVGEVVFANCSFYIKTINGLEHINYSALIEEGEFNEIIGNIYQSNLTNKQ